MMHKPVKTERGWELADSEGILESEDTSIVYKTKQEALNAAALLEYPLRGFDEPAALERRYDE